METVRFWYTFENKNGEPSNSDIDIDISVSREGGVRRDEVCDAFVKFLDAIGFSTAGLEDLRN